MQHLPNQGTREAATAILPHKQSDIPHLLSEGGVLNSIWLVGILLIGSLAWGESSRFRGIEPHEASSARNLQVIPVSNRANEVDRLVSVCRVSGVIISPLKIIRYSRRHLQFHSGILTRLQGKALKEMLVTGSNLYWPSSARLRRPQGDDSLGYVSGGAARIDNRETDFTVGRFAKISNIKIGSLGISDYDLGAVLQKKGLNFYFPRFLHLAQLPCHQFDLFPHRLSLPPHFVPLVSHLVSLASDIPQSSAKQPYLQDARCCQKERKYPYPPISPVSFGTSYRHGGQFADTYGMLCILGSLLGSCCVMSWGLSRRRTFSRYFLFGVGITLDAIACVSGAVGCLPWDWWACLHDGQEHSQRKIFHSGESVSQKYLTNFSLCNTVSDMANVLSAEKQTAIIAALAEGSSIRSIERITDVHRDTIMRLGVKVGKGCQMLMDSKMQDLDCHYLQFDELWGFIGKKERHVSVGDSPELGDVWTFCAIDSETKLVPSFKVGKRTHATTTEFVQDVAKRMRNRVQVSSDAMHLYVEAMELAFGSDVDYGQCVKVYVHDSAHHPERQYSASHFASAVRRPITGNPEMELVSTSYVERLNATTRLHMRRLTRLTLAFSKKLENFEAAVGLHFAYYNFVKRHNTLRCTPAMAAGIERDFWSVGQLLEAAV